MGQDVLGTNDFQPVDIIQPLEGKTAGAADMSAAGFTAESPAVVDVHGTDIDEPKIGKGEFGL
jgi:hypothetical protein